ncbi:SusC/RagA family TonB-linked outer membrane protein [Mucilaginibacter boryungensis]|uniref:TonB-dependent receptor n=1 Tax=Mucilaginibacter boryungensis TaxID=768480 RepID=A0ABR9XDY1_9SPHI|nr:TonB-dependent receptor [Mucilaginibacter boryungensis]MBE9665400.1 TonB-dependent receptor [Mucilaginibacter boryungensis]
MRINIAVVLVISAILQVSASSFAQKITLEKNNAKLVNIIKAIQEQSDYDFVYSSRMIKAAHNVNISVSNASLIDVLDLCFKDQPLTYIIENKIIIIKSVDEAKTNKLINKTIQVANVTGKVTDEKGLPLPGVTVKLKGSTIATVTDANGYFTINSQNGQGVLLISSIGYESREININNQTNITIQLTEKNTALKEVVMVSYGTQNRADVTGSIAQLNSSKVKDLPVGQFTQRLQGQFAGVKANINSGRPGAGLSIQIRGATSINANNSPLIVVDGQPLSIVGGQNPINNINPDEIESFSILKDASATALYGSRAANGVVLITTKQAKPGKTQVDFTAYYGAASLDKGHVPPFMDAHQLATFMNEFFQDKIKYEGYVNPVTGTATVPAEYANPDQYGRGTDWLGQVLRTAPTQSYNLTVSDTREKSSTSIVAGYFKQDGIVINTSYERYSVRANSIFKPTKSISIGLNLAPTYQIDNNAQLGPTDGSRQILSGALLSSPIVPAYNSDGTPVNQASGFFLLAMPNYRLIAENQNNVNKSLRFLGNTYVNVDILKGLSFKTSFNIDMANFVNNKFVNQIAAAAFNAPPPRPVSSISGAYATETYTSWVSENIASYKTTIAGVHNLEVLGGYSIQKFTDYTNSANGTNFPDASIPYVSAAGTTTGTSGKTDWSLLSLFGRVNYNYKQKYLLEGSIRSDGSSKFGFNRKYGVFPTVSAGWVVSNESFMQTVSMINFLKIRSSYGLTGNNNFTAGGNYPSTSLIGGVNYVFNNTLVGGKAITQLGNNELTWEKNRQFDLGLEIGVLNNRINLSYDYYNKLTDGLLYQINIPQSSGFNIVYSNIGTMKFWGHEFTLNTVNLVNKLKWNTSLNITFNRNLITKLGTQDLPIMPVNEYSWPNIQMVGQPVGAFYGYVTDGVYMNAQEFATQPKHTTSTIGSVRMKDVNGDGKITLDDRTIIGNPNPKFEYGITNSFNYGKFDLNIVMSGLYGNQIANPLLGGDGHNLDGAFNLYANQLDHWRSEADPGNGIVPRTLANTTALYRTFNTTEVYSGSYLACRNIALGYTFRLHNNRFINKLRVYTSIQQAFVITNYPNFSPETNNQTTNINGLSLGVDATEYPIPRTITLGLNLGLF